jgi:cytochrome c
MKKAIIVVSAIVIIAACNNNKSANPKEDTTRSLSQTNNSVEILVDTLGHHSDSATSVYEKGNNLITQSDCLGCHKIKEKNIGPSYVEIAEKYSPTPENIRHLTSAILKGSKGIWGEVPMQPHPTISEADATEMVHYILSLKGVK